MLEFFIHQLEQIYTSPTPTSPRLGFGTLSDPLLQNLDPLLIVIQHPQPRDRRILSPRTFIQSLKEPHQMIPNMGFLLVKALFQPL